MYLQEPYLEEHWVDVFEREGEFGAFEKALRIWCRQDSRPTVLLIDEVDSLIGDTLISLLRQLRNGYPDRPANFPQSVILCGVRDVRDYRIHSSQEKTIITGGSAFNIKAESLRLGNFSREDIASLYCCHTEETGQAFDPKALDMVWELSEGQPWVVNALGYEVCFKMEAGRERSNSVTTAMIEDAKERIVLRRETHLDQLIDKLQEDRVRRVIAPILAGDDEPEHLKLDDIMYVRDLGLIAPQGKIRIANRLYMDVIPRELTYGTQVTINDEPAWYIHEEMARWIYRRCCGVSNTSFGGIRNIGSSVLTIKRPVRNCCCRHFYNASSMAAVASSENTGLDANARIS